MLTIFPAKARPEAPVTRPSPELEPQVWSRLPPHLLDLILSRLPLSSLLSLRSTCKHFNSLLLSPSFLSLLSKSPHLPPFSSSLLLSHPHLPQGSFFLFDPILSRWRKLAVPCAGLLSSSSPSLVSSSNGLLCFSTSNSFLVVNLLTKASRTISFPEYPFASATLIPSYSAGFSHSYKLCVVSEFSNSSSSSVYVYDSSSGIWLRFSGLGLILRYSSHQEGVFSNGSLYFTTREPFSVVNFDLEAGVWGETMVQLPRDLIFMRLVGGEEEEEEEEPQQQGLEKNKKRRKLFLVGGVGRDGISRSLYIWELRRGGDWVVQGTLPELMCKKLVSVCFHNYEHVYCFQQEGMICVCCYTWPEVLVYKLQRRTWHWLEKCPLLPDKWSCGFRWFSFAPNLCATV